MRFLRTTILAIGLTSFAFACGGAKKEAEEPAPAADEAGMEEGMEGEEMPEAAPEEGAEDMGVDPCAAAEGEEENPCAEM